MGEMDGVKGEGMNVGDRERAVPDVHGAGGDGGDSIGCCGEADGMNAGDREPAVPTWVRGEGKGMNAGEREHEGVRGCRGEGEGSDEGAKLVVEGVRKVYRDGRRAVEALAEVDMTVARGEFVTLIGPSGCGKSTLFNIVAGVDEPSAGMVAIDGDAKGRRAGKSGYMPQQPLLLPWRTVEENVMLGLDIRGVPRSQGQREAKELLKRFGLSEFAQAYPATLSGGMRQRIALLRTVLFNHSFLLLDEPFGALDALTRLSLQMWLLDLWQSFSSSVLFITHDVREAILLSDRIYVMSARPGRILREVRVELPRPRRQEHLALDIAVRLEQELVNILLKEQKV